MKKIMFNDRYGLTEAVLSGSKTQTRRILKGKSLLPNDDIEDVAVINNEAHIIANGGESLITVKLPYKVGEVVAVAQSYKDAGYDFCMSQAAYINKMFTKAEYMPHHIRITNVRVERLNEISDDDCLHEGIIKGAVGSEDTHFMTAYYAPNMPLEPHVLPQGAYAALIDRISGKGVWQSNPYVFVYDFELVK